MIDTKKEKNQLDLLSIVTKLIITHAGLIILNKCYQSYSLCKKTHILELSEIQETEIKTPEKYLINYMKISSSEYKKELSEFVSVLINKFPKETLNTFYINLDSIKIKKSILSIFLGGAGMYEVDYNTISLLRRISIFHELFHMATCINDKENNKYQLGFCQYRKVDGKHVVIGRWLNEGYTQFMALKYFGKTQKIHKSYMFDVKIADQLDKIVGKDKMEELFLKSDLMGFINELKKYASEEDIMTFLTYVDVASEHTYDFFFFKNKKMQKMILFIYSFLIKAYKKKLDDDLANNKTNIFDYNRDLKLFMNCLGEKVFIPFRKYDILEEENTKKTKTKKA